VVNRGISDHMQTQQDFLMTDSEIAEMVKVPVRTVRHWRLAGILPFIKVGRHPRVWWSSFCTVFKKPDIT
jgi:excisionase family DNA binding protein